jgi:hypothetical protein
MSITTGCPESPPMYTFLFQLQQDVVREQRQGHEYGANKSHV